MIESLARSAIVEAFEGSFVFSERPFDISWARLALRIRRGVVEMTDGIWKARAIGYCIEILSF